MQSQKKRKHNSQHEHCTICASNGSNSAAHTAKYCAYKGGPFYNEADPAAGRKAAMLQKRSDQKVNSFTALQSRGDGIRIKVLEQDLKEAFSRIEQLEQLTKTQSDQIRKMSTWITKQNSNTKEKGKGKGLSKGKGKGEYYPAYSYGDFDY